MIDPVVTCDGYLYERAAISAWLLGHDTAPLTGEPLETKQIFPCYFAREQIRAGVDALVRGRVATTQRQSPCAQSEDLARDDGV